MIKMDSGMTEGVPEPIRNLYGDFTGMVSLNLSV